MSKMLIISSPMTGQVTLVLISRANHHLKTMTVTLSLPPEEPPSHTTLEVIRRMPRKQLITNLAVFVGFILLCMGGGGLIGVFTASSFGDDSSW